MSECESCVALKARIVELEERIEELEQKDRSRFFCKMCKTPSSFVSKQKVRWHCITRHYAHFGLKKLEKGEMNCMVIHKLPHDYQAALNKESEINFAKYYSGKIKISPLSVIS